jgi:uncharacterized protein involved in exopolysaccharide biosynthesis
VKGPHESIDDSTVSQVDASEGEVSLWSYANVLLRRRFLVLGLPLTTGLLVGILSLLSPREYTASASFVPQEPASAQAGLGQLASQFGLAAPRALTSSPQFYADLLLSQDLLREVVMTTYPTSEGARPGRDLLQYFRLESRDREADITLAVKGLRGILTVRTDRVTGVVRFDIHTRMRELSVQIADRFLELINDYNLRRRQSQARAEREFVEQRLALAQDALAAGEEALSEFSGRNRRFADAPKLVAEEARLQRQVSLRQQLYVSLAQSYEAAKIEEVRNTPVITVVERPAGFVEPRSRGVVRNTTLALLIGGFLAVALAFVSENLTSAGKRGSHDFLEFVALWRKMIADLRGGMFRRRP